MNAVETPSPEKAVTIVNVTAIVLRHIKVFVTLVLLTLALASFGWYLRGRGYVAESRFRPAGNSNQSARLSGLAAQLGFSGALPREEESVDFYAELVRSRSLLEQVARTPLQSRDGNARTYIQLNEISGKTPQRTLQKAVESLEQEVGVSTNPKAGTVTVSVRSKWPWASEQINRLLINRINIFNLEKRQSNGAAERRFVQRQLAEAQGALQTAENALEQFQDENRRFETSPDLKLKYARLQRRVDLQQQVYVSLAQEYEKARIEEVRDIPVITVIDTPEGSSVKAGSLLRSLIFAFFPALLLAFAGAFTMEYLQRLRQQHPLDFEELGVARRQALRVLRGRSRLP